MAALPAYAAGKLDPATQAAVDDYLQRQITLFRRLDELEEAAGRTGDAPPQSATGTGIPQATPQVTPPVTPQVKSQVRAQSRTAGVEEDPFAQVMEGRAPTGQIPDNPLLMRKAPQAYIDHQTGQRFVVPRRGTLTRPDAAVPPGRQGRSGVRWRVFRGVLSLITVVAVLLIALYQRNLQEQLVTTQAALNAVQAQMYIISTANRALSLRAENPALQATLLLRETEGVFSISGLRSLPEGQMYQLWIRTADGSYRAAAVLRIEEQRETAWFRVDLPTAGAEVVAAGVSIEPTGGSVQPTLPMLIESGLIERGS